uniref:lysozyme n=1 Tax=Timema poppense TaxID=170557 RepID=A0A7R9GXJ9_TIMPO|nr:unnamed protein product [Timema poppensis]
MIRDIVNHINIDMQQPAFCIRKTRLLADTREVPEFKLVRLSSSGDNVAKTVNQICLGCICEAASDCDRSVGCVKDVCGLFKITRPYWVDSGRPVLANDDPNDDAAFTRCVSEPFCSAKAVENYMTKYRKVLHPGYFTPPVPCPDGVPPLPDLIVPGSDCNGDGVVNCFDYAAIHHLGGFGCDGNVENSFKVKLQSCLEEFQESDFDYS